MEKSIDIFKVLNEGQRIISYRPSWRAFTGSVTATILLQQIFYHWKNQGEHPFYKFKEPCEHHLYRDGDSWTEELGISRNEFDTAIKRIGFKMSKKRAGTEHEKPVEYWVTPDRLTLYTIHRVNFLTCLETLYSADSPVKLDSSVTKSQVVNPQSGFTKSDNPALDLKLNYSVTKSDKSTLDHTKNTSKKKKTSDIQKKHISFSLKSVWEKACNTLRDEVNRPSYNTWIQPITLSKLEGGAAWFRVPDENFTYWLTEYYTGAICQAFRTHGQDVHSVHFEVVT